MQTIEELNTSIFTAIHLIQAVDNDDDVVVHIQSLVESLPQDFFDIGGCVCSRRLSIGCAQMLVEQHIPDIVFQ